MKLSNFDQIKLQFLNTEDQEMVKQLLEEIKAREMIIDYYLSKVE